MKTKLLVIIQFIIFLAFIPFNTNAINLSSNPQLSEVKATDDILSGEAFNKAVTDIAHLISDLKQIKNYVDSTISPIWNEESTKITYNTKNVFFQNDLTVVDTIKANKLDIGEGAIKDNTVTSDDIRNGTIKGEDLNSEIFNSIVETFKLNGLKGYYINGPVGIGLDNPTEKLVVNGNIKIETNGKGIIFPDGTVQKTGGLDVSQNVKLVGNDDIDGIKLFNDEINVSVGNPINNLSNDDNLRNNKDNAVVSEKSIVAYATSKLKNAIQPKCGSDNGNILNNVTLDNKTTQSIINTKKGATEFNFPGSNWITSRTSSRGSANYYNGYMSATAQDHGGEKKFSNLLGSLNGNTYVKKIFFNTTTNIDRRDCRGSYTSGKIANTNKSTYVQIYLINRRQSGRSYDCRGSCNNKNFGNRNNEWSCLSSSCGAGSYLNLSVFNGGKRWNYIYRLNSGWSGNYKFKNEVDLQNKKWHIIISDNNDNIKLDKNLNLPNPTNGVDITKIQGDLYGFTSVGKTCGANMYNRPTKLEIEYDKITTTKTKEFTFIGNQNLCSNGTPDGLKCNFIDKTNGSCNTGDKFTKNIISTEWNCGLGNSTAQCLSYTKNVDIKPPEVKIKKIGNIRKYEDGKVAKSCNEYKNPTGKYKYEGDTGDGIYTINPGNGNIDVYCDMTTDGGGWTLSYKINGESSMKSTGVYNVNGLITNNFSGSSKLSDTNIKKIYTQQYRVEEKGFNTLYCKFDNINGYADNLKTYKSCGNTYSNTASYTTRQSSNEWNYGFSTRHMTGSIITQLNYRDSRKGAHRNYSTTDTTNLCAHKTRTYHPSHGRNRYDRYGCYTKVWIK